ncbi:MAG: glycosyltransferase family 4 protein [Bacteroidota bacterium]
MKVLISHPTSHQANRSVVKGLYQSEMLHQFNTTVASFPGNLYNRLSSIRPLADFGRRSFDPKLEPFTHTYPWIELGRMASSKLGLSGLSRHERGVFSIDAVYRTLDKRTAAHLQDTKGRVKAVYTYEDGSFHTFKKAKAMGIPCLYDLPIGYWRAARKLLRQEQERWPEWANTLTGLRDSKEKLARKDKELAMADLIIVASSFTAGSLENYPQPLAPIQVIPYGFPKPVKSREYNGLSRKRKLKLLYVGLLSQRKGIADTFAVAEALKDKVSLTVVGGKVTTDCPALDKALSKHDWIPSVPHNILLNLMQAHDILVFPSLFEGFGMVITEAMSQGTPVITTDRTAGPDIITHQENGWLVEAASTPALQHCLENILSNPGQIAKMGKAAIQSAALRPWEVYGKEIALAVRDHLKKP